MDEGWFNQVFFENNLKSGVDQMKRFCTRNVAFESHQYHHKALSLLYEPVDEGVLVRSDIQMRTRELVMLQCVAFPVRCFSNFGLERDNISATPSTYPTSSPNIFYSFLEGALGLANPLNAFSFHWLFAFIPYLIQPLFLPRSQIKQLGTLASLPSY